MSLEILRIEYLNKMNIFANIFFYLLRTIIKIRRFKIQENKTLIKKNSDLEKYFLILYR